MIAMKKWVVKTQRKNEAERIVFSSYDRLNASIVYERMWYENFIKGLIRYNGK